MVRTCTASVALLVLTVAGLAGGRVRAAEQAGCGRIDLYVVDGAFNLTRARGGGQARVGRCPWLGQGRENTGVSCERTLGRDWEEVWVEVVPEGDGLVDIDLQGEWYAATDPADVRLVWADRVSVDGASLVNADFEEAGADGLPVGWRFTGRCPPERYSRDGSVAGSGRACVAVWYASQARQAFRVERGKPYRVHAWFRVLDPAHIPEPTSVPLQFPFGTYRQTVTVALTSEAAARAATLAVTPLYDGRDWAVSSRWDDNNPDDLKMVDALTRHGQRGTFYLNSLWREWPAAGTPVDSPFGRDLLRGGHSLGGHSLTHPLLSYCHRNRIFEEVAGVRLVWEAAADTLLNSYSFSYCDFRNGFEGDAVQADIARILERAGFYGVANEPTFENLRTDLVLSPILPADGAEIDAAVEAALGDPGFRERHPNLTHSMHVWYRTPEAWAKFEGQLDAYGHRPDWWYCNQNEYAAYRYQFRHTRVVSTERQGQALRVTLERPLLLDLNDAVPLTLEVGGVPREAVAGITCGTAGCAPSPRAGTPFRAHLEHDRDQALPRRIGLVLPNTTSRTALADTDTDPDFPGLRALLSCTDGQLRLVLDNRTAVPLTAIRVTYRLPLAWTDGVARRRLPDIAPGTAAADAWQPARASREYKLTAGDAFLVAQIDFRLDGQAGRLHTACRSGDSAVDRSYPQGGCVRIGPLPRGQVDLARLTADLGTGAAEAPAWQLPDDSRLTWQTEDGAGLAPGLDPEMVRLAGAWVFAAEPGHYVVRTRLISDRERPVRLRALQGQIEAAVLNGADVTGRESVPLRAGANTLALVCREWHGLFLRACQPGTDDRLTDVRYEPPPATPAAAPYRVPAAGPVVRKSLAGLWSARLVTRLLPAPTLQAPHRDPGPSAEARALVGPEVDDTAWEQRQVPGRWRDYPGEWPNLDGEAVFRRSIEIPAEWAGRDLVLSLGPIDDFDETFVNGTFVGRTDSSAPDFYAVPRRYTVPAALVRPGRNVIAVRVFDHFGDGGFTAATPGELFVAPQEAKR